MTTTSGVARDAKTILLTALHKTKAIDLDAARVFVRDRAIEDGSAHYRCRATVGVCVSATDARHLLEAVDPDRSTPVTLIDACGNTREYVRDRNRDSLDGPGEREVHIEYTESVIAYVLSACAASGLAEVEFVGECESYIV